MKKSDPFQVEALPKAFYYPSKEKELTKKEKKVCLSVPKISQQHQVTSPEDLKFLEDTNALQVQEIPTRENGSFADQSSSSQFNESWPSTEQTGSLGTPVSDVTSPEMSQQMKEWLSGKPDKPVSKSTLGWYINRFRNAPPTSRQIRDKSSFTNQKQGEFWWLSPPSGQSTPVLDTPPQKLKPSPTNGPSKANKLPVTTSLPASLQTSDKSTEDLNRRANELLERSETSINSTSTEPFPLPLKRPVLAKTKTSDRDTIPIQSSTPDLSTKHPTPTLNQSIPSTSHKNPWPEDDILYQWRLARKMEKAQERATAVRSGGLIGLSSGTQRLLNTHNHLSHGSDNVLSGSPDLQQGHSKLFTLPREPIVAKQVLDPHTPVCASIATPSPIMPNSSSVTTTVVTATKPIITSFVSPPCQHASTSDNSFKVPPHMHLACDILPCHCSEASKISDHLKIPKAELPHQKSVPLRENHVNDLNLDSQKESKRSTEDRSSYLQQDVVGSMIDSTDLKTPKRIRQEEHENKSKESEVDKRDFERERNPLESLEEINKEQVNSKNPLNDNKQTETADKMKKRRQRKKEKEASDVVDSIIGKVISEHLFSGDLSNDEEKNSRKSTSESMSQSDLPQKEEVKYYVQSTTPQESLSMESSEEEFTEDEILKMLRQRSRDLKTQLREIDQLLVDNR